MDFCWFHSGKGFKQTGTATAANYNFLNMFKNKALLFDIKNIHFLFWPVVPTNPGCNCCVIIGDSLDFDPCASPPHRLHLPPPLFSADFTRCEAPWVNQWVLPSATLKIRFCAFLTQSLAIHVCSSPSSSKSGLLPLVLISSRLVDHPSISGRGQVPERLWWLSRPALTSEAFDFLFFVSRRNFDHCRVIHLFVQR